VEAYGCPDVVVDRYITAADATISQRATVNAI
jgi:hypothetical protein